MGKVAIAALSVLPVLAILFGGGVWWVRALSAAVFSVALLPIVFLSRLPRELVLLTLYLFWLGAAAFASQRADRSALPSVRPAAA